MGFSVRKRTKGKDSWLNFSYSKRGLHASHSMKFGNMTLNFGKKTRATVNLGDGARYVTSTKKTRTAKIKETVHRYASTASSNVSYHEEGLSSENIAMMSAIFWCLFGFVFAYLFSSVLATIIAVNVAHFLTLRWQLSKYPQDKLSYFIPTILMITPIGWIYLVILFLVV